ncbi:MAG: hypothetical protein ACI88L_000688 [Candidatus Paceibacteria bacterium]|jgi:hypothetical protein
MSDDLRLIEKTFILFDKKMKLIREKAAPMIDELLADIKKVIQDSDYMSIDEKKEVENLVLRNKDELVVYFDPNDMWYVVVPDNFDLERGRKILSEIWPLIKGIHSKVR